MRNSLGTQPVFCECGKAARLQDPRGFGEKLPAVGHVHGHVLGVGAIEHTVCIWQVVAVSLLDNDAVFHPKQRGELIRCLDKRLGDIDAMHLALKALREIPCGAAKTAPDIEDMVM